MEKTCFQCGQTGHVRSICPQRGRGVVSLIDIGANLAHKNYRSSGLVAGLVDRAVRAGVQRIIVTGTTPQSSGAACLLAYAYPTVMHATAGIHPHNASMFLDDHRAMAEIERLVRTEQCVVAIGECGLDYNRMFSSSDSQIACFTAHLELAASTRKPLFMHERDAHDDFVHILAPYCDNDRLGPRVVHCFTGGRSQALKYLSMGCHLGITGFVTQQNRAARELREMLSSGDIPLDRIMLETDAPFMMPRSVPLEQQHTPGQNEPAFLPHVLKVVAKCCNKPESAVAATVLNTTRRVFQI